MQQSLSVAFPSHRKKEVYRENNDKTNTTYETIDKEQAVYI